ncbi:MAG: SpoIID/LytB domain-containing protein [Gaiellaceae bacterium]
MIARRPIVLAVSFLLLAAGAASAAGTRQACSAACTAAAPGSGPLFVVTGHGWGHGVGLSQYGAYGYARHGWTYDQIVLHYYPGTSLGPAPLSRVRVLLADARPKLSVSSASDFKVRDGSGRVTPLPAGPYSFGPRLKLKIGAAAPAALQPPLTFLAGAAPFELGGRSYRGSLLVDVVDGKLRAIDEVGLEQYLYGVVPSEMPSSWAPEALKAQAVVARSYALATRRIAAPFDLYADTRSQVYLGIEHERPSTNAAVGATAGEVVLYGGQVARTYFYSTSGGRTANGADVWGTATPYLVSVPDPYDAISPYHDWGPVVFTGAKLAKTFHVPGQVTDVRTLLNASGRVTTVSLLGTPSEDDLPAARVRAALKLRSTWFDVGVLSLFRPSPAPPVEFGSVVQLSGLARGIAQIALEQRPAGAGWQPVGPVSAGADGTVALSARPSVTTDYRLSTPSVATAAVHVTVAPRLRFSGQKTPNELRGLVRPVLAGAPLEIQRQNATGTWTTVAKTNVDANGNFDTALQLSSGVYRARVAATRGLAAGTTPTLRVVAG